MPIYQFRCKTCGRMDDHYLKMDERNNPVLCPDCQQYSMVSVMSTPIIKLEGFTGAFPSAYDRWEKVREQKRKQEIRQNQSNG